MGPPPVPLLVRPASHKAVDRAARNQNSRSDSANGQLPAANEIVQSADADTKSGCCVTLGDEQGRYCLLFHAVRLAAMPAAML